MAEVRLLRVEIMLGHLGASLMELQVSLLEEGREGPEDDHDMGSRGRKGNLMWP